MIVRDAVDSDLIPIYSTFIGSVMGVDEKFYDEQAKRDWVNRFPIQEIERKMASSSFVIAELEEVIVGFASLEPEKSYIHTMFVHPSYERRGVGKAMFFALKEKAIGMGLVELNLKASKNGKGFYEGLGFVLDGELQDSECLIMRLKL